MLCIQPLMAVPPSRACAPSFSGDILIFLQSVFKLPHLIPLSHTLLVTHHHCFRCSCSLTAWRMCIYNALCKQCLQNDILSYRPAQSSIVSTFGRPCLAETGNKNLVGETVGGLQLQCHGAFTAYSRKCCEMSFPSNTVCSCWGGGKWPKELGHCENVIIC